jgi:hypothetical protein
MCSCSGSCNCNSTTIPRGPQGVPGSQGAKGETGNPGVAGGIGLTGNDGKNAFTTLTGLFIQPEVNFTVEIAVVNTSWVAVNQIIYIGTYASFGPGGFYKVTSVLTPTSMIIMRMDWTIPGVTFRATSTAVGGAGTIVTPSGTIGPTGDSGVGITEIQNQGTLVTAPLGTYTAATTVTTSNQICTSNGAMAKFVFIVSTFSSSPPSGPDKPYFKFNINSVTASIRSGTLAANEIKLDVTSSPSFATMEFTIKRLSQTSAVCFVKAYLDSAVGTKSIANYIGDVTINPIDIDFAASNTFNLLITLPQTMSYSLVSSWVEEYKS